MSDAWEGYALSKGIKKKFDPSLYPTKEEREELHRKIRERDGNA